MLSLANPQFHLYSCNKINLSHSHSQLIRSQYQQNLNLKLGLPFSSSSSISLNHNQNPFRFNTSNQMMKKGNGKSIGAVCYNSTASLLSPPNLQWVCVAAAAALMIAKGTSIQKSFLVPLFILQAPREIFNWIKGEYGIWTVFLALAVRLFYFIPKELELPLYAMLFVIASPHQVASLRGTEAGSLISLGIAGFLAFQHFTGLGGNVQKGFEQGSILATIGIIGITLAPLMLLIGTRL
ncbi:hypothetical protein MKW94_018978 [Papaver nudicaule]|uniref:Uncharacterized protein n=1 Tax=Papaver nudicaule TaxID=74823 RepID=A0AA41SJD7_PAPNU|nr:hypothetical protein [Papaver nudicaule]